MSETTSVSGAGTGGRIAQTAQDKAGQGAAVVTQQTSEVTETAKQQAAAVAQEAGAQARQLAGGLREQLHDQTRVQGERLAQNLRSLADELRQMGEHARGDSVATTVVRRLAEGGHQVADHLERRGPGGLLDEVQDFARRRPGLFLAGAALAGFAVGRAGKDVAAAGSGGDGDGDGDGVSGNAGGGVGTGGGYGQSATAPTMPINRPVTGAPGAPVPTAGPATPLPATPAPPPVAPVPPAGSSMPSAGSPAGSRPAPMPPAGSPAGSHPAPTQWPQPDQGR